MERPKTWLPIFCIIVIAIITFFPCFRNGFVNWDDQAYVLDNHLIRSLSFGTLKHVFSSIFLANYQPLTIVTYIIDYNFFKLNPLGYHLVNILLHIINCVLVFWLIYKLRQRYLSAFIVAMIFCVHPLHVESVAWVSGRKDLLFALFFLAAIISYCYYIHDTKRKKFYYFSLALFIFSLFSKAMSITLPIVLFLVDYLFARKASKNTLIEKIPFVCLSLVFGCVAVFAQRVSGGLIDDGGLSLYGKTMIAVDSIVFYISKTIFPLNLSCVYPYSPPGDSFFALRYYLSWSGFIIFLLIIIYSLRYARQIFFGGMFFLITILPALQIVPMGYSVVADRYAYIPLLGIIYILAELAVWPRPQSKWFFRAITFSVLIMISVGLSYLSWQRCKVWKSGISLWGDVIKKYPSLVMAYRNRGNALLEIKEYDKARHDFINAISIDPDHQDAYFSLGRSYYLQGNKDEAIKFANKTLQIDPGYLKAYDLLSAIYGGSGRHQEVIKINEELLKAYPKHVYAYINLSSAFGILGDYRQAVGYAEQAVRLDPYSPLAHFNLSVAYFHLGEFDLAVSHCKQAIKYGQDVPSGYLEELNLR